ncbi:MAG: hypothetical protein GTN65_14275, partial [Armatimonadetes bacterium]|nr:hypothetical protein [Armatimonadota bacterium]NIO98227.1 hypothetical protein [Armatimonadota bacterium]
LIDEPTEMDADAVAKFHEGWPKYIAYSEGMHTLYEAHEYPLCGADPLLTGISGEVFRSALDLYGHDTSGVADLEGALAYIRERLWSDPANIVRDEVAEFHQLERAQWAEKQAELGTNPSELPSLLYAEHQAARNSAFRKANGRFCYTVNVLGGNLIYWLAFYRGADFRRKETIHFEIMKRLSPWLTYHHFAQQTWRPELLDPHLRTHPVELETAQAREMVSRTDWRCQIDTNPRFRAIIRDYLLSFPISHSLWDVIDRQKLEEWFNHPTHSNMSRFGFFGALTIAMILDDRR